MFNRKTLPAFIISIAVLILDQLTKAIVIHYMALGESIPILQNIFGETFMLTYVANPGAAFSIGFASPSVNRVVFILTTLLAMVFILYLLFKSTHRLQIVAFGLVLGGAMGNLIDRILRGPVTDFIDVDFPDFIMQRFPIFNLADSAIFIAVCLLLIDMIFKKEHKENDSSFDESAPKAAGLGSEEI